ncbi:MAG: carboxypeptidase regulatory-like domain-containing protein [Terriglobales bacterium]
MRKPRCSLTLRLALPLLALALLALFVLPAAWAQSTGQIQGVVTDPSGSAIPGVAVLATNAGTGATRSVETGVDGRYLLTSLPPGTYTLTYSHAGFSTTKVNGILIQIGSAIVRHDALKVATQQTTVEVNGTPPPIDVTKSNVAGVVTAKQITQLPIQGREYLNLATLMPGTTQAASRTFYNNVQMGGGGHFYSNSFTVDGVNNNWAEMGEPRQNFPEGAVQEFKVYTSQFSANVGGMSTGGAVAVVTKSGTNVLHGDAFEFFKNQAFNRDNSFQVAAEKSNAQLLGTSPSKAPLQYNQFGGDIGGPIVRNKLHFFGSWESTLEKSSYTVFTLNPAIFGSFNGVYKQPSHDDMMDLRVDYQIDANQMMFVRWAQEWNMLTCQGCGGEAAPDSGWDGLIPRKSLVGGHTWQVSSHMVNNIRFQYARSAYLLAPSQCPNACGQDIWTAIGQFPAARINLYSTSLNFPDFSLGSDYGEDGIESHWEYKDTLSIMHGAHNMEVGADYQRVPYADDDPYGIKGQFNFNTDPTQPITPSGSGVTVANLYYPASGSTPAYGPTYFNQLAPPLYTPMPSSDMSFFFNDAYSGIRNLNVTAGLRYDREFGSFDENLNPASFPQPVPDLGDPSQRGDKHNFGPRLGLSWDIGGGPNILRAGYGMYYGNLQTLQVLPEARNFLQNNIVVECAAPGDAGCPAYPSGQGPAVTQLANLTVVAQNYQNPYSEQYNLGYSREISSNFSINVDGVYELTERDFKYVDLNYGDGSGNRPLPQYGQISQLQSIYHSKYKALYVRADKRFSNKYQFLISYTLSSCMGDGAQAPVTDYSDWGLDWGPCSVDQRNALVASSSYQAPWGVTLGAIYTLRSSLPFSLYAPGAYNIDGSSQYVPGTSYDQGYRNLDFGAINAYITAQNAAQGLNAPLVSASDLTSQRVSDLDLRASRAFKLGETRQIEVIGQVFNLFGTYNYSGNINTNLLSAGWGQPYGAGSLQQAELAVKFSF